MNNSARFLSKVDSETFDEYSSSTKENSLLSDNSIQTNEHLFSTSYIVENLTFSILIKAPPPFKNLFSFRKVQMSWNL